MVKQITDAARQMAIAVGFVTFICTEAQYIEPDVKTNLVFISFWAKVLRMHVDGGTDDAESTSI